MHIYRAAVFCLILSLWLVDRTRAQSYLDGIDLSKWNGTVNWNSLKNAGIDFAFTKATEGVNFVDQQYHNNTRRDSGWGDDRAVPFLSHR